VSMEGISLLAEGLGYELDYGMIWVRFSVGPKTFLNNVKPAIEPTQWVPVALSSELKRPERKANHSNLVPKL
jgi:hypothetical protein